MSSCLLAKLVYLRLTQCKFIVKYSLQNILRVTYLCNNIFYEYLYFNRLCGSVQKRNVKNMDFGMGRGHSGALEAQYRMALENAFSPDGPGRKKRFTSDNLIDKLCNFSDMN